MFEQRKLVPRKRELTKKINKSKKNTKNVSKFNEVRLGIFGDPEAQNRNCQRRMDNVC